MRSFYFLSCLFVSALGVHAGQQTFLATPYSLSGWSLIGAELPEVLGQPELILPANAQLMRSGRAAEVSLQLSSRPVLGEMAVDWPVVELGDAALVLSRKGDGGRLFLVLGEQIPRELPFTFALDVEGRSVDAITFDFTRTSHSVRVTALGQTVDYAASPRLADEPLFIVVSAGAGVAWSFQRLVASFVTVDPVGESKTAGPVAAATSAFPAGQYHGGALPVFGGQMPTSAAMPKASPFGNVSGKAPSSAEASSRNTLEIYTPPSVRQSSTKVIRAAVQAKLQN